MIEQYPYPEDQERLTRYRYYTELLEGEHYEAFTIQGQKDFTEAYNRLRYVTANFCGLISKVSADFLFNEEIKVAGDVNNDWLRDLYFENKLGVQLFESALSNSSSGDAVLVVRVQDNKILIEDTNPAVYHPILDTGNMRSEPKAVEIGTIKSAKVPDSRFSSGYRQDDYLVIERHEAGTIKYEFLKLSQKNSQYSGDYKVERAVQVDEFNALFGTQYEAEVPTGIDEIMVVHIPNFKLKGNRAHFGDSDYKDIESLQFAINNRLTKTDNILDKHSDPILAVPPGILGPDGKAKAKGMKLIEIPTPDSGKPEYIVWNANLESAFAELERLIDILWMVSEISPAAFGLDKNGVTESGRALKMKLIRTIAKRNRKRLYYDYGIKRAMVIAQKLSAANGYTVNGNRVNKIEIPIITWADGVVNDEVEEAELAAMRIESGTLSKQTAIERLDDLDETQAKAELDQAKGEKATFAPTI